MAAPGTTRLQQDAERRTRSVLRSVGEALRAAREDAGLSQRRIATVAGISQSHLSGVEAGEVQPSIGTLVAVGLALGGEASIRFFPGTGPRIRDRIQASMVETLIRVLHPRWSRFPEVPVYRPASGVIDLVLADASASQLVAAEFPSQLRRLEQQMRWARAKADSLPSTTIGELLGLRQNEGARIGQLLVLRSTHELRTLATDFEQTLAAAYPAHAPTSSFRCAGPAPDLAPA